VIFRTARSLAQDEAAPMLARFYMSPPANPSGSAYQSESKSKGSGRKPFYFAADTWPI